MNELTEKEQQEVLKILKEMSNGDASTYNSLLKTLAINDEILPVSLKKTPD